MTYNTSFWDEGTNLMDLTTGANTVTNGLLGTGILFVLFAVLFMIFREKYKTSEALLGSSFISVIAAILLWALRLFPIDYLSIPIFVLMGSLVYVFVDR